MFNYIRGNDVLLYIRTVDGFKAVSCLIDNPLEESTEVIETTSRGGNGFRSYIPGIQDYSISFTANLVIAPDLVSYEHLRQLKRERTIFEWRLGAVGQIAPDQGTGFLSSLSLISSLNGIVTFSGIITPSVGGISTTMLLWSQNGFNVVTENGSNAITV